MKATKIMSHAISEKGSIYALIFIESAGFFRNSILYDIVMVLAKVTTEDRPLVTEIGAIAEMRKL